MLLPDPTQAAVSLGHVLGRIIADTIFWPLHLLYTFTVTFSTEAISHCAYLPAWIWPLALATWAAIARLGSRAPASVSATGMYQQELEGMRQEQMRDIYIYAPDKATGMDLVVKDRIGYTYAERY